MIKNLYEFRVKSSRKFLLTYRQNSWYKNVDTSFFISILTANILHPTFTSASHGPVSISDKTCHRYISQSLKAPRLSVKLVMSFWNWEGSSAVVPLTKTGSIEKSLTLTDVAPSWLTRSDDKASYEMIAFNNILRLRVLTINGLMVVNILFSN